MDKVKRKLLEMLSKKDVRVDIGDKTNVDVIGKRGVEGAVDTLINLAKRGNRVEIYHGDLFGSLYLKGKDLIFNVLVESDYEPTGYEPYDFVFETVG